MKYIIKQKTKSTNDNYVIDFIIDYKRIKTKDYIIMNSLNVKSVLQVFQVLNKIDYLPQDCEIPTANYTD